MFGQLLTLIDLFILANHSVSHKVVKAPQTCSRNIFETRLNTTIIHRMRKTRRRCVVLACIMTWFGDFAWMKKFVFFFAWKDASFGFRNMTWQWMSTFAVSGNYCSLDCCFIADDENCCREMLVGCTAELQKPWFLPYTFNSAQIFVNFIHGSPRTSRKQKQEYILVMLVLIFSNEPQCWWSSQHTQSRSVATWRHDADSQEDYLVPNVPSTTRNEG